MTGRTLTPCPQTAPEQKTSRERWRNCDTWEAPGTHNMTTLPRGRKEQSLSVHKEPPGHTSPHAHNTWLCSDFDAFHGRRAGRFRYQKHALKLPPGDYRACRRAGSKRFHHCGYLGSGVCASTRMWKNARAAGRCASLDSVSSALRLLARTQAGLPAFKLGC